MQFNADQMRKDALIPEGLYKFKVIHAQEKTSSTGNQMINLKLEIWIENRGIKLFDSLILIPKMFWKIDHFCEAVGLPPLVGDCVLWAGDFEGKEGNVIVGHFRNNQTGEIEAKVKDYVIPESVPQEKSVESFKDDEVPDFK